MASDVSQVGSRVGLGETSPAGLVALSVSFSCVAIDVLLWCHLNKKSAGDLKTNAF